MIIDKSIDDTKVKRVWLPSRKEKSKGWDNRQK